MGLFFIDTSTGQVATFNQLRERGVLDPADSLPPRPWLRVQGTSDATTLWYSVLRREIRPGVFIGSLCIRHSDHHASLLGQGWQEVDPAEIGEVQPSPWTGDDAA